MRAIQIDQFGDPAQVIHVVDIEEPPPPGPHEVLVSVEVSPLNKHDLLVVAGVLARPPLPHIPGAEGVARVLAIGPEVDGLSGRRSGRATPVCAAEAVPRGDR
jgi:NADPH:quinone reductase-like Zn-dependent oxidoreductase